MENSHPEPLVDSPSSTRPASAQQIKLTVASTVSASLAAKQANMFRLAGPAGPAFHVGSHWPSPRRPSQSAGQSARSASRKDVSHLVDLSFGGAGGREPGP